VRSADVSAIPEPLAVLANEKLLKVLSLTVQENPSGAVPAMRAKHPQDTKCSHEKTGDTQSKPMPLCVTASPSPVNGGSPSLVRLEGDCGSSLFFGR
jgi:hypothetical protein